VVFDVGETLVDETRQCEEAADAAGVPRFTFMALAGAAIARGLQPQEHVYDWLGVDAPQLGSFGEDDLYPDALPCLRALRERGLLVGAAGNMGAVNEYFVAPHVDFVASSERFGVRKPQPEFFMRLVDELERPADEIAYVGDRVDNDVVPALAAGMVAVHVRRGPWGYLQEPPDGALSVRSLDELRTVLA
jgi:HAD superfamily hydrolase (TIGR01549 family)